MKRIALFFIFLTYGGCLLAQEKALEEIRKSVYFGGGSYYIDKQQIEEIRELIESIPNLDRYQISITSHTDNIGGREYNEWLSQKRSDAVLEQLIQNNIPHEKVFIKDFGQNNPLYNNGTTNGRRLNRRVDIHFTPLTL